MSNDYKLLLGRSIDLEDHEINVFEAAFLSLMKDASTHPSALAIYVEEILGLKRVSEKKKLHVLKNAVQVRTLFLNIAANPSSGQPVHNPGHLCPLPSAQEASIGLQIFNSIKHPSRSTLHLKEDDQPKEHRSHGLDGSLDATSTGAMDDPTLTEYLAVYREAKIHFEGTEQNTEAYFTIARILRDKAKDCIQYLSRVKPGDSRLAELRSIYEQASIAESGEAQGTKRRREYDCVDAL
ncbi:MAG: hypothetical protein Q9166_001972 [cf. Caloplaca sp. 2 TL-2023]